MTWANEENQVFGRSASWEKIVVLFNLGDGTGAEVLDRISHLLPTWQLFYLAVSKIRFYLELVDQNLNGSYEQ